jgi:hypothetical protein
MGVVRVVHIDSFEARWYSSLSCIAEGCNGEHVLVNKYILFRGLLRNGGCGCRKSRSLECGQGHRENKVCD